MSFVPTLASLYNEDTDYKIIDSCNLRLKDRQAAPEKIVLCKNLKDLSFTVFWFHADNKKEMNFNDLKQYIQKYSENNKNRSIPTTLSEIYDFLWPLEEKKQIENIIHPIEKNKSKLKL
jgi:hypothetical protein